MISSIDDGSNEFPQSQIFIFSTTQRDDLFDEIWKNKKYKNNNNFNKILALDPVDFILNGKIMSWIEEY